MERLGGDRGGGDSWERGLGVRRPDERADRVGRLPAAARPAQRGRHHPGRRVPARHHDGTDGQRFSFFGNDPDPGVTAGTYRRVQVGDCFGATPGTAGYGHLRYDASCPGPDDEYLQRFVTTYSHAALIGANAEPSVSGDEPGEPPYAAAIFLHRHTYVSGSSGPTKPTSGCVSPASADLTSVLRELDADALFVMGPMTWLLTRT